jgi:nicotinate-nucleotide adenylyltransferase
VAARPGYSLDDVVGSLPKGLRPSAAEIRKQKVAGLLELPGVRLHLLPETHEDVSATQIRAAMQSGTRLKKLVPDAVAEYIRKERLYRKVVSG